MWRSLVVTLAGCGRIGFGTIGVANGDGGDDGGVACDGISDIGCACTDFTVDLPLLTIALAPVVWTGHEFLIAVDANGSQAIQTIHSDGTLGITVPVVADTSATLYARSFAWNGSVLGLGYAVGSTLHFAVYDPRQGRIVVDEVVPGSPGFPHAMWTGDRFALTWDGGADEHVRELDATGATLGAEILIPVSAHYQTDSETATATGYAFGVRGMTNGEPSVLFANRPDFTPIQIVPDIPLANVFIQAVAGTGGLAVHAADCQNDKLQILTTTGTSTASGVPVPMGYSGCAIAGSATHYEWVGIMSGTPNAVVERTFDNGAFSAPLQLATFPSATLGWSYPTVVATDQRVIFAIGYGTTSTDTLTFGQHCK